MIPLRPWLAPALLLLLVACAAPTGSLEIDVHGLPTGLDASITVTGPGNYGQSVMGSTTLAGLTPGTYEVIAAPLTTAAISSEYVATITPARLDVVAGETATTQIAYALRGGTLTIGISGLPLGLDADVNVTGPDAFTRDVSATTVLAVTPGGYSATANAVTDGSSNYTPTVTGSPAEVSSAAGAGIDISYEVVTGGLDIAISGLPSGLEADVLLEGIDGFSVDLTGSATVTDLPPGRYGVTVRDVSIGLSTYASSVMGTSVEVASSTSTSLDILYELVLGTLDVTIGGLPAGLHADVLVEGPSGYAKTLTSSTTLVDLALGEYELSVSPTDLSGPPIDPIVSGIYDPSDPQPITLQVASGGNAAAVTYQVRSSFGKLWTTHNDSTTTIVTGIAAEDLVSTGAPTPAATISGARTFNEGIAFDGDGNAWITNGDRLEQYLAADLATDGSPTPNISIEGVASPIALAFDALGNLFVLNADFFDSTIVVFTPNQLLTGGNLVPAVTISGSLDFSVGLAFDASGNLWVANGIGDTVVRFGASQLTSGGSPDPEAIIMDDGSGDLEAPTGVAFDAAGNLWVVSRARAAILKFEDPGSLSGPVSPTADVVLEGVDLPTGLAFDNSGSLWVSNSPSGNLLRFEGVGSLSGTVTPTANAVITGAAGINLGMIAFYPPPADLPIVTP